MTSGELFVFTSLPKQMNNNEDETPRLGCEKLVAQNMATEERSDFSFNGNQASEIAVVQAE